MSLRYRRNASRYIQLIRPWCISLKYNRHTSKESDIMVLIRRLVLCRMRHNILVRADHVPGRHNVLPDLLSRSQIDKFKICLLHGPRPNPSSGVIARALSRSVLHLLNDSLAPSTKSSYRNALRPYVRFHMLCFPTDPVIPVHPDRLAQFVASCQHRRFQPATVTSYVSAISYVHKIQAIPNPADSFVV